MDGVAMRYRRIATVRRPFAVCLLAATAQLDVHVLHKFKCRQCKVIVILALTGPLVAD
jgi:hypothetical protein